jgi:ribosomal protein S1
MKRAVLAILGAFVLTGGVAFAHGNGVHVRGTVVTVSNTAITIQVSAKQTRTIPINEKTMIMKGAAHLSLTDVKVGDRVVIDVDKKTSVATEVMLGTAAPASTATTTQKRKG